MNMILISKKKNLLTKEEILNICKLKNSFWKWDLKNQKIWFENKVKSNDINNLIKINNKIVGYTLLRKRSCKINNKKEQYLYFDTFIISEKYRNRNLGRLLMEFNNSIILSEKKFAFLICKKELINFYKLSRWKQFNSYKILDHQSKWLKKKDTYGFVFNNRKAHKGLYLFLNK